MFYLFNVRVLVFSCCSLLSTVPLQIFQTVLGDLLLRLSLVSLVQLPPFFITPVSRNCLSFTCMYSSEFVKFQDFFLQEQFRGCIIFMVALTFPTFLVH